MQVFDYVLSSCSLAFAHCTEIYQYSTLFLLPQSRVVNPVRRSSVASLFSSLAMSSMTFSDQMG
jgi:hypothetical protein